MAVDSNSCFNSKLSILLRSSGPAKDRHTLTLTLVRGRRKWVSGIYYRNGLTQGGKEVRPR